MFNQCLIRTHKAICSVGIPIIEGKEDTVEYLFDGFSVGVLLAYVEQAKSVSSIRTDFVNSLLLSEYCAVCYEESWFDQVRRIVPFELEIRQSGANTLTEAGKQAGLDFMQGTDISRAFVDAINSEITGIIRVRGDSDQS